MGDLAWLALIKETSAKQQEMSSRKLIFLLALIANLFSKTNAFTPASCSDLATTSNTATYGTTDSVIGTTFQSCDALVSLSIASTITNIGLIKLILV